MAAIWESEYFPPLEHCLNGDFQLLSWRDAFNRLNQPSHTRKCVRLRRYLTDDATVEVLKNCLSPFPPATAQSKTTFDTRTSAINIAPTARGRYDIQQIKEDALWLSKEVGMDEMSSLRISILEWQARPADQIFQESIESQSNDLARDDALKESHCGTKPLEEGSAKYSKQVRRSRVLYLYIIERQYILKLAGFIIFQAMNGNPVEHKGESTMYDETSKDDLGWLENIGNSIIHSWLPGSIATKANTNWIVLATAALQTRVQALDKGSDCFEDISRGEELKMAWIENRFIEMIHIMQLIFTLVHSSPDIPRSDVVLEWFKFMHRCRFFNDLQLLDEDSRAAYVVPFQGYVAMTSLVMLKVSSAQQLLQVLSSDSISRVGPADSTLYLENPEAIQELNDIFREAAEEKISGASLALLGWSIILQTLREFANLSKEQRQLDRSEHTEETYESAGYLEDKGNGEISRYGRSSTPSYPSTGSDMLQPLGYLEEILDKVNTVQVDGDLIAFLARRAVNETHVFDVIIHLAVNFCMPFGTEHQGRVGLAMRLLLLDLLRSAFEQIGYEQETVSATLAVLTGSDRYWDILERPAQFYGTEPAFIFLNDPYLMETFFTRALSRFPYETLPFVKFCRALAISKAPLHEDKRSLKSNLDNMEYFACALPPEVPTNELWKDGMLYRELASDFTMYSDQTIENGPLHNSTGNHIGGGSTFQLPTGTMGLVMSNENQFIIMWYHKYSGLSYMGQILLRALSDDYAQSQHTERESNLVVAEIIGLISTLLMSTYHEEANAGIALRNVDEAQAVLEEASTGLNRNQDIISVVFALFEKELHKSQSVVQGQTSITLLMRCNEFMHALVTVLPGRVWSFLSRSSLLGLDGKGSRLSSVVASIEIVSGRFGFLSGCLRCFQSIIDDAMTTAVSRKVRPVTKTRFGQQDNCGSGLSEVSMKKILLRLMKVTVDVFESLHGWKFEDLEEKLEISATVCQIMLKVLRYCFGMDDNPNLSAKLTGSLALSAEHLVNVFLSQSNLEVPIDPLLQTFLEGLSTKENSIFARHSFRQKAPAIAALKLSTTLTKVQKYLGYPPGLLEKHLFKCCPVFIKLYAINEDYKVHVIELLESLIQSYGSQDGLPPSLIGSFSSNSAKPFIEMLGAFDSPSDNWLLSVAVWRFASAIVSQRQPWFAIYLLTGSTPREALKGSDLSRSSAPHEVRPMLQIAIDRLSNLDRLQSWEAINILEFVKSAADFWPLVLTSLQEGNFLTAASAYLTNIDRTIESHNGAQIQSEEPPRIQIAALIVSILAMYVHECRGNGDTAFAKKLQPSLAYLIEHAVATPKYNTSLHSNLRKNFESKFPQCSISNFRRTALERSTLGDDYFYNTPMACKMLSFDPAWSGKNQQGFIEEFRRANRNFSVVESRVNLLHSWEFLVLELSYALIDDASFHTSLVVVIQKCLEANAEDTLPDILLRRLAQSRLDLAFSILQQVLKVAPKSAEAKTVLEPAWNTLRRHAPNLGTALVGSDANYDRTLLKLLYVALQIHALDKSKPEERRGGGVEAVGLSRVERAVLEILGTVVAKGFRSLTTTLHEDVSSVLPMDFILINAILRTALSIHNVERHSTELISHFTDDQTARYAATLLSWSDRLTIDNDPVYGEVSITFLAELSAAPALAESIAVEGILAQVSNAALMNYFRRPEGIGPCEEPIRMHRIWARGVLPLILNLLKAVGAPVAGETSGFLAQFQNQISRTANSFDAKANGSFDNSIYSKYITLNLASEAHSLTLITMILDSFREAGPSIGMTATDISAVVWERAQLREDLLGWMQRRKALRESIIATNEREEVWVRQKPLNADSGAENLLEEKIVAEFSATIALLDGQEK